MSHIEQPYTELYPSLQCPRCKNSDPAKLEPVYQHIDTQRPGRNRFTVMKANRTRCGVCRREFRHDVAG